MFQIELLYVGSNKFKLFNLPLLKVDMCFSNEIRRWANTVQILYKCYVFTGQALSRQ